MNFLTTGVTVRVNTCIIDVWVPDRVRDDGVLVRDDGVLVRDDGVLVRDDDVVDV